MLLVPLLAPFFGVLAGGVAYGLYSLIAFLSNLIFFQRISVSMPSLEYNTLTIYPKFIAVTLGGMILS